MMNNAFSCFFMAELGIITKSGTLMDSIKNDWVSDI
jgi:hypothetical protein